MITVTLGTIPYPFNRAIHWLASCLERGIIWEPVFIQHGVTNVDALLDNKLVTAIPLLRSESLSEVIHDSRLVISHAGQGSTRKLARSDKSFTLLPRQVAYGEHIDNHQLDFAQSIMSFGVGIHVCMNLEDLEAALIQPPPPIQKDLFEGPKLSDFLAQKYPGSLTYDTVC